jgi:large repetitive protein
MRNINLVLKTTVLWAFLCLAVGAPIVFSAPNADVDLAISKSDSVDPVIAGESLTYQLTITNAGPAIATGVAITDTLPIGVTYTSASIGCVYNASLGIVRCDMGEVGIGSVTIASIQVLVDPAATGTLLNQATVSTLDTDTNASNDTIQETTTIISSSDLSLTKTAPAFVIAGDLLTYTLTINNAGSSDALGVVLEDDFPPGIAFVSSSIPCSSQGHILSCNVGSVAANTSTAMTATFRINSGRTAPLVNNALVSATTPDPDPTNNDATLTTPVSVSSDMTISKNGTPEQLAPGEILTYTITVTNNGRSDGQGVTLTDSLPAQFLYQSYSATKGACTGTSTITCTPGVVIPGEIVTITLVGRVNPAASPGTIMNTVIVTSTSPDPDPGNNSATENTTITGGTADLQITKQDMIDPVRAGELLTYIITINNAGPSNASGVMVSDSLPVGVTLQSATSSQGSCILSQCNLGGIAAIGRATITMTVSVDPSATGVIANTATLSANETDPNMANNSAQVTTAIVRAADLSIQKTGTPEPVFAGKNLAYRLQISNQGPSSADGVHMVDALPSQVSFVSAPPGCSHTSGTVDCMLGRMLPDSSLIMTITVQVNLATTGLITNIASVSSTAVELIPSNNQSQWVTNVLAPDLVNPTVSWLQPVLNGQRLNVGCQMVHLQVSASDNLAIEHVRFFRWDPFIGGGSYIDIGFDTSPPYQWDINTCELAVNWNQIFAQSQDTYGNLSVRQFIWLYRYMNFLPLTIR